MRDVLIGVLVGGAATGLVNWLLQLQHWKHEKEVRVETERRQDRTRWHADRHAVYVSFMRASDYEQAGQLVMLLDPKNLLRPPPGERGEFYRTKYEEWATARRAVRDALAEVDLIGSQSVRQAAREYDELIDEQQADLQSRGAARYEDQTRMTDADRQAFRHYRSALEDAREAFVALVRQELAVDGSTPSS